MLRKTFLRGLVLAALAAGPAHAAEGMANAELMLPVPTVTIYPGDTIKESMLRMQAYPATYRARTAVIGAAAAAAGLFTTLARNSSASSGPRK